MRKIWGAAGLAAFALTVSACASSGSSSATTGNTPAAGAGSSAPASSAPAAAGGSTVTAKTIGGQQVLVDSQGMTLYWFAIDTPSKSNCTGSCLTYWPPVKGPVTAGSGVTGTLGTITRSDGTKQATYLGHPLYTYVGDKGPGQNKGNGLNISGGLWWEMTVSGSTPPANAAAGSTPIGQILAQGPTPVPSSSPIYIERALINPSGNDAGLEVIVLASLATTPQTLSNWRLIDKNARVTPINTTIGPGQSVLIALDGKGAQLGNQGGNLILQDNRSAQVDVVTYTAEDASQENRYVRFRR